MFTARPLLARFLIFVCAPLLAIIFCAIYYFSASLPTTAGNIFVSGLNDVVEISRDKWGIPHVKASNDRDAFFAIGYLHAQDRMWQLELQRRTGNGRLSEIFGRKSLKIDQMMRTLGFHRVVRNQWSQLGSEAQSSLQAYAAGVNQWIAEENVLPIEFLLLGLKPEPWTVYDSLVWLKLMAWNMSGNYEAEIDRMLMFYELGVERAEELLDTQMSTNTNFQKAFTDAADIMPGIHELGLFSSEFRKKLNISSDVIGSNAWAVAGRHTVSGAPLLANDPHLQMQTPSLFYLARIEGSQINTVGATLPGLPITLFGYNKSIGWGVTAVAADVQDLYYERVAAKNPNQYEYQGQWYEMNTIEETINIKPDFPAFLRDPIEAQVWIARSTRHGPVISDVVDMHQAKIVALKWSGFNEMDKSYDALLALNYAGNWGQFNDALRLSTVPTLAFAYADTDGNIGYKVSGFVPIRVDGDGRYPIAGWEGDFEWQGWVPFKELPGEYNPERGYVVLANHKLVDESYPYMITRKWEPSYRADRISSLLQRKIGQGKKLTLEDMQEIQGDQVSLAARAILPYLTGMEPRNEKQSKALAFLRNWDADSGMESVPSSIFQAWYVNFQRLLLSDELRGNLLSYQRSDFLQKMIFEPPPSFFFSVLSEEKSNWCDNTLTTKVESCEDMSSQALDAGISDLEKLIGRRISSWRWGEAHNIVYPHTPFSNVNVLDVIFERRIPSGGDHYTVNLGSYTFSKTNGFEQRVGASYRHIVDLGEPDNSVFVNTPGQSGNVFSKHYSDGLRLQRDMGYLPMTLRGDDNLADETLTLQLAN